MSNFDNDNPKMQDSLDNMSNIKLRQSSLQKHRVQLIQVKQKFISLLQKLQTSQTRQISISQIKKLLQRNNQSDHLRIYLSILKSLKPNHNSTTKQHQILVISIIAKVFKSNLIDTVEKQSTLLKTCFRVVEILLGFFNDNSNTVQHACARVLLDLNQFCLEQGKYQKQQKISVLFAPLISILKTGVDKASQSTATVCINELLKFWYLKSQKEYLDLVSKQVFSVIMKINSQYHEIFMAAIILIEHKGLAFFENNKLPNFLAKILPIIDGTKQGLNSFNAYMCKVNVCKIMEKVAVLLKPEERQRLGDLNIVGSLAKAARNKIIQVQMAATRALKVWKGEPVSQQKLIQRPSTSKGKPGLRSLQEMRDQKKRQRSNSKQNTIKIQNELNYMKQDLQKMVKGGWGANNRAKNFIKRGSGVGGGHYGQYDSPTPPKSNKSHKEHLQQLRSMIKQGVKENKNVERFDMVKEYRKDSQQQQQQRNVPTSSNNNVNPFIRSNNNNDVNQNVNSRAQSYKDSGRNTNGRITSQQVNNNNDDDEFMQADDSGDQAVYIPQTQQQFNKLKQIQKQKQKQQQQRIKKQMKSKDPKFIQKQQRLKKNLAMLGESMISQRQLQELMLENNLSDVSDNMGDLINESDLQEGGQQQQQLQVKQNNFMRKTANENAQNITPANYQNTYNSSLNYTQSRVTNSYKSTLNNKNNPKKQQFTLNPNNGQYDQSTTGDNNNKFTNIKVNHQNEQQIEEDIVESYFEESKDVLPVNTRISHKSGFGIKKHNKTNKQMMQKQQQKNEQVEQSASNTNNYQQLIQHPPTSYHTQKHFDRKSFIKQQQQQPSQTSFQQHSPQQPIQTITDKWLRILSFVQNNDINSAFEQAFQMDDPIYLIRLLIITKTPISALTAHNCSELWGKFLEIYRHNFIAILFVQLFTQANDLQLVKNSLTIEEMHDLLLKLYEVSGTSKGKLSFNAALLYNKIDESLRPGKKL